MRISIVSLLLLPFAATIHIAATVGRIHIGSVVHIAATSARRSRPITACDAPPADPPRIISFSDAALAQV